MSEADEWDMLVADLNTTIGRLEAENRKLRGQLVGCAYMFDFIRDECDWEEGQDCTGDERIGDVCLKASERIKQAMEESK
jgi:hypothetical protein